MTLLDFGVISISGAAGGVVGSVLARLLLRITRRG